MRFPSCSFLASLCAITITFAFPARAAEFTWPDRGLITLDAPADWDLDHRAIAGGGGYAFKLQPKSGAGALQITLANTPTDRPIEPAKLPATLEQVVRDYVDGSVEKKFSPQPLALAQGAGVFVQLTDASLVGQPAQRDNFKMMRNAIAALDAHALAIITLQFDDATGPELPAMMEIVRSLRLRRLSSPGKSPIATRTGPFEFSMPEARLRLRISDAQLVEDSRGPGAKPGYFKLSDRTVSRIVSGWFEPAERYSGLQQFWRKESAGLAKNGFKPEGVEFTRLGDWEAIFYHQTLTSDSHMCHLRAQLVRAGTWIDLHLSATGSEPLPTLRERLTATLASVEISER